MGFEESKSSPFDKILRENESTPKVTGQIIEISGTVCDVRWRESEPNVWTVYINGLPVSVTKNIDGNLVPIDTSPQAYHAVTTESRKAIAVAAVTELLQQSDGVSS